MSQHHISTSCIFFTIAGTGVQVKEAQIAPSSGTIGTLGTGRARGRVRRIVIREAAGGLATSATFYLIHNNRVAVTSPSTEPDENVIVETAAVPLTASASVASLDSPISAQPAFQNSLLLVADVTAATGAWSLTGFIEIES